MAKMTLDELVAQLRAAYGNDLNSVVLYGSAASGEHIPKRSDYNVLVIVKRLGLEQLRAAAATSKAWAGGGNPPPLTFTADEWRSSSDIFPMEYADILERHRVLFGSAPFDGIRVDPKDLRLQLEHEAMGKLLMLRQGVLGSGGDERRLIELLADSATTIMVIFRALLRLHGSIPPRESSKLIDQVATLANFDGSAFHRAMGQAKGVEKIPKAEGASVMSAYIAGMQQLVSYIDKYAAASG